jgi:hypothetical protein
VGSDTSAANRRVSCYTVGSDSSAANRRVSCYIVGSDSSVAKIPVLLCVTSCRFGVNYRSFVGYCYIRYFETSKIAYTYKVHELSLRTYINHRGIFTE